MAQSFMATATGALAKSASETFRRVLVTRAAGRIGPYFAEPNQGRYELCLMVQSETDGEKVRP